MLDLGMDGFFMFGLGPASSNKECLLPSVLHSYLSLPEAEYALMEKKVRSGFWFFLTQCVEKIDWNNWEVTAPIFFPLCSSCV